MAVQVWHKTKIKSDANPYDPDWSDYFIKRLQRLLFSFAAPSSGPIGTETIYLGPSAGDYGPFGDDGLLTMATALMPNNPTASAAPVPEPSTILLVSAGLIGLAGVRKKIKKS